MLVTDKDLHKIVKDVKKDSNAFTALRAAREVRDIYEARLNEILKLTDKATEIIQDLRETHNDWR